MPKLKKKNPKINAYRDLGKTGLKISDISLGTGKLPSPSMVLRAIDRGINYMDTAPDYGSSEQYIGEAMNKIQRDKVIIATKILHSILLSEPPAIGEKEERLYQGT